MQTGNGLTPAVLREMTKEPTRSGYSAYVAKAEDRGVCLTASSAFPYTDFFSYTKQAIFDPRLVYDLAYKRWIVAATALTPNSIMLTR